MLEVVQQLTKMFKPDFKIIKKRIEDLISRDYLERDKDNPNVFGLVRRCLDLRSGCSAGRWKSHAARPLSEGCGEVRR